MAHRVCPWWIGYFLLSPLRKLGEHPRKMLQPHVGEGMTVLEPGCGMGYFTLELARMVGAGGRVVAVDLQEKMLAGLRRRARRAGLSDRLDIRSCGADSLGITDLAGAVDLIAAVHVVHEMPDQAAFFTEVFTAAKEGGRLLVIEPKGRITEEELGASITAAEAAGFGFLERPPGAGERAALLEKRQTGPGA